VQSLPVKLRGIDDVIAYIDSCPGIVGRAGLIWWLALGGLFLDAFANSALSAGLGPMTRDLGLSAGQVALMMSFASWVAIAFNPIGGWMADRWGRMRPLITAKLLALIGALLVVFAPSFDVILAGRFFVGAAYGIDFAIAMAVLAEFTPVRLKSRLNTWQGMWYTAVCSNLLLALLFHSWEVGDAIWRYSVAATAVFALAILVLLVVFAPYFAPQNPYDLANLSLMDGRLAPRQALMDGSIAWLGTDDQGRDMLSAILYGLRISLMVGVGSALIAGIIGTLLGLLAAYAGGKVDALIMRLVDLILSFPSILVAMMILAFLGKGVGNVVLTLVILEWAYYARTARGQALVERRREYVEAARCLDIPNWRIMLKHILPNCLPPLIVIGTLQIARAITLEATLSFLGLGVPVTEPSLGLLISNGFQYMLSGEYWISFYPGIALLITIVAINLVGDRLRDVLNPRTHK